MVKPVKAAFCVLLMLITMVRTEEVKEEVADDREPKGTSEDIPKEVKRDREKAKYRTILSPGDCSTV